MMVKVVEEDQTNHIDQETQYRYRNQTFILDLNRLKYAFNTFTEDVIGNEYEEYTVKQPTDGLYFAVSICIKLINILELRNIRCHQSNEQSNTIKQHMKSITDQT